MLTDEDHILLGSIDHVLLIEDRRGQIVTSSCFPTRYSDWRYSSVLFVSFRYELMKYSYQKMHKQHWLQIHKRIAKHNSRCCYRIPGVCAVKTEGACCAETKD